MGVRMIEYSVGNSVIVPEVAGFVQVGSTGRRVRFCGDVILLPEVFREPDAGVFTADGEAERAEAVYPVKNA